MTSQTRDAHREGPALPHITARSLAVALAVAAVLAAAAYLRFRSLGHAEMWGDQSLILGLALRFVRGGALPLAGIKSSAGIMNPPLTEYLLALPLAIRQEILPAVVFNALLGFLAVMACFAMVARLAGWRAALIATTLFAVNPWAVHYSRFLWNQNFVPLFATLLVGLLLLYLAGPHRPAYLAIALLSLAAVIQLHLAALILIPIVAVVLLIFHRSVALKPLLLGVALFVLSFVPFLLYMKLSGFADLKVMLAALGGQNAETNLASFLLIRDLVTGNGLVESAAEWQAAVWPWQRLGSLEGWLCVGSLAYAAGYLLLRGRRGLFSRPPEARSVICLVSLLWMLVPGLFYVRHTVYLQNYYFIYIYPVPFILIGVAADHLLRSLRALAERAVTPWLRHSHYLLAVPLLGLILAIAVWQFHLHQVRLDLLDRGLLYSRQAQDLDRLIVTARDLAAEHPGSGLVVISEGHSADTSPFGLLADFLPFDVRYVEDGRGLIVPAGDALYLDTSGSGWLQSWLGEGALAASGEEIRAGKDTWHFYYKPAGALAAAPTQPLGAWASGIELRDGRIAGNLAPGGTADVTLLWHATQPGGGRVLHFFNHLVYLPDSLLVSQQDGPGVHSPYWQPGDTFITRFQIPIPQDAPAGRYEIRVGMYGLVDQQRVPLAGGGDALTVANIELPAQ